MRECALCLNPEKQLVPVISPKDLAATRHNADARKSRAPRQHEHSNRSALDAPDSRQPVCPIWQMLHLQALTSEEFLPLPFSFSRVKESRLMPSSLDVPTPIRKSTQALNYFARKAASGAPVREMNKMKALKLLFFADRFHLRKYGRPVSECEYFAMNNGPVASEAKRVAEERLPAANRNYARHYIRRKDNLRYGSVNEVDHAVLSQSDIEALDFSWGNFGHYSEFDLAEISHHYPEWKRHAAKLRHPGIRRVEMEYADFFDEPDAGYNPCHPLNKKDREIARELYLDTEAAVSLWK
jgi:uncharacterized phage-associated protein